MFRTVLGKQINREEKNVRGILTSFGLSSFLKSSFEKIMSKLADILSINGMYCLTILVTALVLKNLFTKF